MALQEIGSIESQVEKEVGSEKDKCLQGPSVTLPESGHNGLYDNTTGFHLSEEEKLEADSHPSDINSTVKLSESCDRTGVLNASLLNGSDPDQRNLKMAHDETVETEKSPDSFVLERVNSSDNSSSESLISDEASFGNSTDDQLDSVHNGPEEVEHDCLSHPAYISALHQIEEKHCEFLTLSDTLQRLKDQLAVEIQKAKKYEELELRLLQYERELELSKKEQEIDKRTFEAMKKEWDQKYSMLKKELEVANRERENIVMRYAVSEKELLDVKKEKDIVFKKLKESMKENETLMDKLKVFVAEKSKTSQLLDSKITDLSNAHKEIDKLKEEINSRDIKIKWTQNKLKTEMETHKECPQQIDKLMIKIRNLEEELNFTKQENQNLRKELQESEQNKILENQLKEEQAKLIMERHEHSEIDLKYKSLHEKHQAIIEENNILSLQVQRLETERLEMEKKLSSSREETEKLSNHASDLQSKLTEMDSLTSRLKQSEDKVNSLLNEIERVRHQNEELLQDMASCRAKETEMLSFTQKLTTKNVQLQSEFTAIETKASDLEKMEEKSRYEAKELKEQVNDLQVQLNKEKAKRDEETRLLARQVAEKKRKGELLEAELLDTKAALTQTKSKHGTVVKELQRELSNLRRKLENIEAHGSFRQSESLNSLSDSHFIQACDLPTQNLVERILKLQGDNAKLAEKIEFLEEHSAHLLGEVQRKSRLLQSYILREEAGALAPSFLDNHKAEVTKHGGIMASLYGGTPQDDGMSLELCLEINRKLQVVLEDTLLKNIMLKENLDTLGDEISRLTSKK